MSIIGILLLVVHFVVGFRLILLAKNTRQPPEFFIGLTLILLTTASVTGMILDAVLGEDSALADMLVVLQLTLAHLSLLVVLHVVFRREWWATIAQVVIGLIFIVGFSYEFFSGWQLGVTPWGTVYNKLRSLVAGTAFVWGSVECFLAYSRLRKQVRFGLAPASTAIRILLWGFSMVVIPPLTLMSYLYREFALIDLSIVSTSWLVGSFFTVICVWFSFFPPESVIRWFDQNADSSLGISNE